MRRLLIRPGALGDLIVSLPALEALRAGYTEVWVPQDNTDLIRFADRARAIGSTGVGLLGLPGIEPPAHTLAALAGFDQIVSWYGANRLDFRAAVAHLPFTFFPALPPEDWCGHAVDFYVAHARAVGGQISFGAVPRLEVPAPASRSYAVIHPFSGSARKNWLLDRFRAVAAHLSRTMPVLWSAGPEEELEEAIRFTSRYELACWLAGARVYLGNDSGVTHLAAAVGTPVLALFGPTSPAVWSPRSSSTRVLRPPNADMREIGVAKVISILEEMLREGG